MKKIVLNENFNNQCLSSTTKAFLIDLFFKSNDYKVLESDYNELCIGYPDHPFAELLNEHLRSIIKLDNGSFILNKEEFKNIGISIIEDKPLEINSEKSHKLMASYNEVRNVYYKKKSTGEFSVQPITLTNKKRQRDCKYLIDFLEAHKIDDWYFYIYTIFASCNWTIVWNIGAMYSPRALDIYISNKDKIKVELSKEKCNEEVKVLNKEAEDSGDRKSIWIHTFPHIENQKKNLQIKGDEKICISQMPEYLGYHPLSSICRGCKLKKECAQSLYDKFQKVTKSSLDILKIRGGVTSIIEAKEELKKIGSDFAFFS